MMDAKNGSVGSAPTPPHQHRPLNRPRGSRAARHGLIARAARFSRGISYEASLIVTFSLLVLGTGLAVTLLSFRATRASTTPLAHALFQEVSDHAVTQTRGFLLRAVPVATALGNLSGLGLAT